MTQSDVWDRLFAGDPSRSPAGVNTYVSPRRRAAEAKRLDIQGLRAVAVLLVILFHAGVTSMSGGFVGVDVFFVISGFLITGIITRQLSSKGTFGLGAFYANRARRLLPAAFVTIAATCIATYLILPGNRFDSIARDALASAGYVINWRLSRQSIDYLAQAQAPSPFQHFWSLAVEEQFYIVWPLLLVIAGFLFARKARNKAPAFAIGLTAIFVPSLVYSITETSSNPAQAYFVTPTRMWELALGGGLALAIGILQRLPVALAAALGWVGLIAIGYSAFAYTGGTPFPGYAALLPTIGAAAVIATGQRAGATGPALLLRLRPLVFLGNISYSLYLWHWPLIVLVAYHWNDKAPVWAGLAAGFGAIIPAYLSYRFVEQPTLRGRDLASTFSGLRLGFVCTAASLAVAGLLLISVPTGTSSNYIVGSNGRAVDVQGNAVKIGAQTLTSEPNSGAPVDSFASITPDPTTAANDIPRQGYCIVLELQSADQPCIDPGTSSTTVELVGDSHAMQWYPALAATAATEGWRVIVHTKQSCPFNVTTVLTEQGRPYPQCDQWNRAVTADIVKEKPILVITSSILYRAAGNGGGLTGDANRSKLMDGYRHAWDQLTNAGIHVAVLADTPRPSFDIVGCVVANYSHLTKCARPATLSVHAEISDAARADSKVTYVDLNRYICPTSKCAAVIGSVLVYRDSNHLTATYAATLAGQFRAAFVTLATP